MTHFLSTVTQRRLDVRKVDMERTESHSLVCLPDDFHGQLRCVTAVGCSLKSLTRDQQCTLHAHDDSSTIVPAVWCGEQDGSITVRSGSGGAILKVIPRKVRHVATAPHVFVFALCSPRHDQVWAGMSDGFVRVFHSQTCELTMEFHAHAAAITAFSVVSMPTNDLEFEHHMNVVVTASYDWTIAKWDTTTFRCLGKLMGHRVAVRSIGASRNGEFLVSGGEDGSLRMWSLVRNEEVQGLTLQSPSINGDSSDADSDVAYQQEREREGNVSWPILPAHQSAVSGVCVVHDEYIVSIGLDGVALIWSLGGECLHELDRRNCGLSSVMHDVACARLWVGGIDGNIHFFSDDSTLHWDPLGSAQDHSGCYVSAMVPIRQDHLQQMWLLDDEGNVTKFVETLSRDDAITQSTAVRDKDIDMEHDDDTRSLVGAEGIPTDDDLLLSEELDELRQTAVRSYGELRRHRLRLAGAEAFQRSQRQQIVYKFGDGMREAQSAVFRVERWLMRRKFMTVSLVRCCWMERASHRTFLSICLWRWLLWSRESAQTKLNTTVASAVQSLTWNTLKAHTARQLKLSLHEKQRWGRIKNLVSLVETRGLHALRHRYFSQWFAALVSHRKTTNHEHMASAKVRLFGLAVQIRGERDDRIAFMTEHHQQRMDAMAEELRALSNIPILRRYYDTLLRQVTLKQLDTRRVEAQSARVQKELRLMTSYFWKWARYRAQRTVVRETERREDLDAEVVMWNELIREGSAINAATLKQEEDIELAKARRRSEALEETTARARELLDVIHEIKSDLVASGLRLDPNLGLDGRVDAIFTYMKARGINTHKDVATISAAREDFVMLPLYVAPPPPPTAAAGNSPRTSTPLRRPSVGTPRRGSAPAPGKKASSPTKKKAVEAPRSLLIEFEDELKRCRKHLTAAIRGSDAAVLHAADQLLKLRGDDDPLADDDDWYISPESIKKCSRRELRDSANSLRRMICLYDCIRCKQDEAANAAVLYRSMVGSAPAKPPSIPVSVLRCVLCNTPALIQLALHDFNLSAMEYVTAEEPDAEVLAPIAVAAPRPTTSPRPKPSSAAALPVRRNSSPAASVTARRNSSPAATVLARRTSSPAQPLRGKLPVPRPVGPRPTTAPDAALQMEADMADAPAPTTAPSPPRPAPTSTKAPSPKASSPKGPPPAPLKPFLGLRVAVGAPQAPNSRVPSLIVAECNETYPVATAEGGESHMEGPAFSAGLRVGDVITRFAGYAVTDLAAFNAIVSRHCRPGAVVPVQVLSAETKESRLLSLTVRSK